MAAIITYHSSSGSPSFGTGFPMPIRPRQSGDNELLTIGPSAQNSEPATDPKLARILFEENCWVLIGPSAVATPTNAAPYVAGDSDDFVLAAGDRISVIAR